ncbi:Crotonobetainyl-CoA:carnitine CoA-transferase CaiB [Roseomonas rosea]|uniref:Crotonobetainyl-CoA:carnitine CoA-transferase CaiB n=1 Tax=Muricoccus roseus TaxID=198092 RepID=A0A1M6PSE1_9PROT|nr:CoA transferase [Roseomonas rosea]SHK10856.1 Crotonobetainyl-CoA:carnitine CoA-transferase CaiB [Roseomonas rosea]
MHEILKGIRVVEQGTFITGPCAAMALADLGADVIKVEAAGDGDPYRAFGEGLYSPHFQAYNRNKRAISLNLREPADEAVFRELAGGADVFIQNFRPGAAARMGADHARLSALNPGLVYCSISGFGPDGPYRDRPSYDSVTQALSGFLSVATDPARPRLLGPALADAITGLYAALGVLGALVERGRSGRGRLVEVSMLEAMTHFAIEPFTTFFALGEAPDALARPRLAHACIVACADGRHIGLHLSSLDKFWRALVEALGGEPLSADPRFATRPDRIRNYEALVEALDARFAARTRPEWLAHLATFDLPHAPLNSVAEAEDDAQSRHLGLVVPVAERHEGAERAIRPAFTFDGARAPSVRAAPRVDEHGAAIRRALAEAPGQWPARPTAAPREEILS